jgi:hypothetical protein
VTEVALELKFQGWQAEIEAPYGTDIRGQRWKI